MPGRIVAMAAVLFTALLLQTVLFAAIEIAGWRPDLLLLTVVAFGLVDGRETGLRYGFVAGICVDLLYGGGHLVGVWGLVLLGVGYAAGVARPYIAANAVPGHAAVGAVASAGAVVAYALLALLLDLREGAGANLLYGVALQALYGALLAPAVTAVVHRLSTRFPVSPGTSPA